MTTFSSLSSVSYLIELEILYTIYTIIISDAPLVTVSSDSVHGGRGRDVTLTCTARGEPSPSLRWFYGDRQLRPRPADVVVTGSKYLLHLKNLSERDFGNYSCVAENSLGTFRSVIVRSFHLLLRLTESFSSCLD